MKKDNPIQLHFCTSLGVSSLPKLLALYWSLLRHSANPFVFWILCDGDEVYRLLFKLNLEHVRLVPLTEFEKTDIELYSVKRDRDVFEYNCTLRPCWMLYLLSCNSEIQFLTYMDTDLYFFSDPLCLYDQLDNCSVLLSEHRFSKLATRLGMTPKISGVFNAGWLTVKNDKIGHEALLWWRKRCLEWCRRFYEDGKFGEQKYLESMPELFQGAVALNRLGGNVAPWNVSDYLVSADEINRVYVDNEPLIFFHFHALQMEGEFSFKVVREVGKNVVQLTNPSYVLSGRQKQLIYKPYIAEMKRAIRLVRDIRFNKEEVTIEEDAESSWNFKKMMIRTKAQLTRLRSIILYMTL
ncbi:hypothetical protein [Polynucleobacter sp. MWH-Svant-W18]|uniref:hypothetical protein n=1 Tax=Polynucleobacter sp. MWH-Svant-W18 TaxID=1855909 RepID=UPI001BFCEA99|nr:hypothetical protein [Polynucleobacter sp. MWH-Svant-W18]QWD78284.1 hypothetical protein C2757_01645 [Polynucleobacter sp. MWH-Svant-W18]